MFSLHVGGSANRIGTLGSGQNAEQLGVSTLPVGNPVTDQPKQHDPQTGGLSDAGQGQADVRKSNVDDNQNDVSVRTSISISSHSSDTPGSTDKTPDITVNGEPVELSRTGRYRSSCRSEDSTTATSIRVNNESQGSATIHISGSRCED